MPNRFDPWLIQMLEQRAKESSNLNVRTTGQAEQDGVGVRYYPACQRYAWFNDTGPISKRLAIKLLKQ